MRGCYAPGLLDMLVGSLGSVYDRRGGGEGLGAHRQSIHGTVSPSSAIDHRSSNAPAASSSSSIPKPCIARMARGLTLNSVPWKFCSQASTHRRQCMHAGADGTGGKRRGASNRQRAE